jgi:acyl-CoA synthetase (AMP-forming)/AMP-acid ligase II/aryl carrier-like protein
MFDFPERCTTLIELLRGRAELQPDRTAYTFLADGGESEQASLSYGELDRRARALAARLQRVGTPGERALLLYPPGLDFIAAFFGCLYAGIVAVPAYPPRPNRPLTSLRAILTDSTATLVLTTRQLFAARNDHVRRLAELDSLHWIATDEVADDLACAWREPAMTSESVAFLQYTSGSTSLPRGVMVSHSNLLHNQRMVQTAFEHTDASTFVGWLPLYHDMGLIGNVLQPLYVGTTSILMAPLTFLQSPVCWLRAISRYRAQTSGGPNFAYELCVRKISVECRRELDLSRWSVAFSGAEPVRHETLERFTEAFAPYGFRREAFYPCYGLAEATLFVTGGCKSFPPVVRKVQAAALEQGRVMDPTAATEKTRTLVSCGRAWLGQEVAVVNPQSGVRCPPDQVGEIWAAGASVAQGYWKRPDETRQTFGAYLNTGGGPFLRTGDLGFWEGGELFVTGRLKDLIIIRGRNLYPQDVEKTASFSHPRLRPDFAAAFSVSVDTEERLVVVQEVDRHFRDSDVIAAIASLRQAVAAEHEVEPYAVVLVRLGNLPLTSSGKLQRRLCRSRFLAGELEVVGSDQTDGAGLDTAENDLTRETLLATAPVERGPRLRRYLKGLLARALHLAAEQLSPQEPLAALGLDSLRATELQHRIERDLGISLPMADFLGAHGIAPLAENLLARAAQPPAIAGPDRGPIRSHGLEHPLSHGQRALWFLHRLAPESTAFHIASAVRIKADLNVPALRRTLLRLLDRHAQLRSTFATRQGEPVQRIHPGQPLSFKEIPAVGWDDAAIDGRLRAEAFRPFDLESGPLFRVALLSRSPQEHFLLLAIHHLVADFWSVALLLDELGLLYPAETVGESRLLPSPTIDYTAYVRRQRDQLAGPHGERLRTFWRDKLANPPPPLHLAAERPRAVSPMARSAAQLFAIDPPLAQRIRALGRAHGVTLYVTLLSAFQVLLYRYTGQQVFLIGSPTSGRNQADLAGVVGYFVNPVVLRADLSGDPTFAELLRRVRCTVLASLEHQDYPFNLVVEQARPPRDNGRSPLFQVMFTLQKAPWLDDQGLTAFALGWPRERLTLGPLTLESLPLGHYPTQAALDVAVAEIGNGFRGYFAYDAGLFDPNTIARMVRHFETLLGGMTADPDRPISTLPLTTAAERRLLISACYQSVGDFRGNQCMHEIFAAHAAQTPDRVAAVASGECLTYAQLDLRARRLAGLIAKIQAERP